MSSEDYGLPENFTAIDQPPIRPGQVQQPGGAPPLPNAMGNYFQGSISPTMQHDAVFVGTKYGSPTVPTVALMPIAATGVPAVGSAIQSAGQTIVDTVEISNAAGSTGQVQFNNGGSNFGASSLLEWNNMSNTLNTSALNVSGATTTGSFLNSSSLILYPENYPGADVSVKINNCIAALISAGGGTCDARNLPAVGYISQQINVGNASQIPITLILPSNANWGVTISDGTSVGIMVYGSSCLYADCPGTAHSAVVGTESGCDIVAVCSTYNGGAATQFVRISGISFDNINNGTVSSAVVVLQSVADNTIFENSQVCNPYGIGLLIGGSAAGVGGGPSIIKNVWMLGANGNPSNNTAQPLVIQGNSNTGGAVTGVRFLGCSIVEAGAGHPNVRINGGGFYVGNVSFFGTYQESTINSSDSTAMVIIDHAGPTSFFGCTGEFSYPLNGAFFVQMINSANSLVLAGCELGTSNFVDNDVTGIDFISNGSNDNVAYYADNTNSQIAGLTGPASFVTATANLTAQTANVAATTLYAVPASGAGLYEITVYMIVSQAATSTSELPDSRIIYTDRYSGATVTIRLTPGLSTNTTSTVTQNTFILNAKASTNIQYDIGQVDAYASSGATAMQFAYSARAVYLG
jgi:hypothetical protein